MWFQQRKLTLYHKEIFAVINLAHYFDSAFTPDDVFRFLRVKIERDQFDKIIENFKKEKLVYEKNKALFAKTLDKQHYQKKRWSRGLFTRNKIYLTLISKIPWINYAALTGANAFESCENLDDIDLFLVTQRNRLWLCYIILVLFSKLLRKRNVFCINYLVDESNISIPQQNYFTAVQLIQMIPLVDNSFSQNLIAHNMWVFDYLPNASPKISVNKFYLLRNGKKRPNKSLSQNNFLTKVNRLIFRKYKKHLLFKYPKEYGNGIILREGLAKLNRVNHQNIYEKIFEEIYNKINATLIT